MHSVNLAEKFRLFDDYWSPKIVGEVNDAYVKLTKLKGEFVWHHHEAEDELFLVVKGRLLLKFRDRDVWVEPGEFAIVPRGVEHLPVAPERWTRSGASRATTSSGRAITPRIASTSSSSSRPSRTTKCPSNSPPPPGRQSSEGGTPAGSRVTGAARSASFPSSVYLNPRVVW